MKTIQCLAKGQYALAESPLWNPWRKSVLYIDIIDKKVYEYHTEDGSTQCIHFDEMVGTVALVDEGTMLVAEKNKLVKVNLETHAKQVVKTMDLADDMRVNDGKCDTTGRLWVGSIGIDRSIEKRLERGSLYSIEADGEVRLQQSGLTISNGMAWDMNKQVMYFTDTYTQKIDAYDYASTEGVLSYRQESVTIPKVQGGPDGFTIDCEGMLWVALWGGGCVLRINPANAEVLERIEVPEKNVTCCIFGGEKLDTLYITTASDDEGNKGSLYCVQTETTGIQTNVCRGSWLDKKSSVQNTI